MFVWGGGAGKGRSPPGEFTPAFQETQSSRSSLGCPSDGLVIRTSNPGPPPICLPPSLHTPLPLSSTPSEDILHPPRGVDPTPLHGAHLQVCEGRRPTKADCVLIKFIICGELILNGNLSPSSPKGKLDYSLAIIPMKLLGFSLCCTADGNRLFFFLSNLGCVTPPPPPFLHATVLSKIVFCQKVNLQ